MTAEDKHIKTAHAAALTRWQTPFPGFASGQDPRTSDNALLALLYGGLKHAADHEWLNAGRRLIDKTYVDMLWQVQGLENMRTCRPEQVSAALDDFIQGTVCKHWDALPILSPIEREELTNTWVHGMAKSCFGSLVSELAASRVLFYLCPTLPVFNLSRGHLITLEQLGYRSADNSYASYARSARAAFQDVYPVLGSLPRPAPAYGNATQQALILQVLDESDWWARRIFDELLRKSVGGNEETTQAMFACDDAGQLTT